MSGYGPSEEAHKREKACKRAFTSQGVEKVQVASIQGRIRPSEAAKAGLRGNAYVIIFTTATLGDTRVFG